MININHYTLDITLEFQPEIFPHSAPGLLRVKALLEVENAGPEPASVLPLLFYRLYALAGVSVDGKAARVTSRITGLEGIERHHVHAVTLELPEALPPGASCRVSLEYGGVTAGAREVWPYIWDAVTRDYTLLRPEILWYPVAAPPDRASHLRATYLHRKHFDVTVQVPEGYMAVAPGLVSIQDGMARFRTAAPRERFDLAVARFTSLESGGVTIYHLPDDARWGSSALGWVNAALKGLTDRLGPRSTGDLAIVQIPQGWGSQNTPHFILQEAGLPDNWHAAAEVLHEVSHFWTPLPADPPRRFSDEALASFFQAVLVGDVFGPEKAHEQMVRYQRSVDRAQGARETRFLDEQVADNLHGAVWYARGALEVW
ncbi:MAG: hypothetical protein ACOY94_28875 [Bacillota bacterium]